MNDIELGMSDSFRGLATEMDSDADAPALTAARCGARWYAAYTCANHEKKVSRQFSARMVDHYLPVYRSVRRWKDRKVNLEIPLFPGYVFVRMALHDRMDVLKVPGVASLVSFDGTPAALPDDEIARLRAALSGSWRAIPHPYLAVGRRVSFRSGPMKGFTGILLRRKKGARIVVSVESIQRSVAVEVDEADLAAAL
jgi:transcription antitermination factor NusG